MLWVYLTLIAPSLASPPVFQSSNPDLEKAAYDAWETAIQCTGWEPSVSPVVTIRKGNVEGAFDSAAGFTDDKLVRIDLGPENPRRDLLHELAHAWARKGPATLTEGRADWLADCIATSRPDLGPLDPDSGGTLSAMEDLRKWTNANNDIADDTERMQAYQAAARWIRIVAEILPRERLFPKNGELRWRQLIRGLEKAGPKGVIALSALEGGVDRQREALSDQDRDGQPRLLEILQGTQPDRWDSDGDGWWDGAKLPKDLTSVPIPLDGSPVCSGLTSGSEASRVYVRTGGAWRGPKEAPLRVLAGDTLIVNDPKEGVRVEPHQPILLLLDGVNNGASGGVWVQIGGQGLSLNWNCHSTPRYTIWVRDPKMTPFLYPFENALKEHLDRARTLLGPQKGRLVIHLGTPAMDVNPQVVQLSSGFLEWAQEQNRPDAAAALAIALQRVWSRPLEARNWDTAEAMARSMMDNPPPTLFVSAP